jgi:hypothetical protein
MGFDFPEWDSESDPKGNVRHIAHDGLSIDEGEDVVYDPGSRPVRSRRSKRPTLIGQTSTGKTIIVIYERHEDASLIIRRPVAAYGDSPGLSKRQRPVSLDESWVSVTRLCLPITEMRWIVRGYRRPRFTRAGSLTRGKARSRCRRRSGRLSPTFARRARIGHESPGRRGL